MKQNINIKINIMTTKSQLSGTRYKSGTIQETGGGLIEIGTNNTADSLYLEKNDKVYSVSIKSIYSALKRKGIL